MQTVSIVHSSRRVSLKQKLKSMLMITLRSGRHQQAVGPLLSFRGGETFSPIIPSLSTPLDRRGRPTSNLAEIIWEPSATGGTC